MIVLKGKHSEDVWVIVIWLFSWNKRDVIWIAFFFFLENVMSPILEKKWFHDLKSSFPIYNITVNNEQYSHKLVKRSLIVKCYCKKIFLKMVQVHTIKRNMYVLNKSFHNFHDHKVYKTRLWFVWCTVTCISDKTINKACINVIRIV